MHEGTCNDDCTLVGVDWRHIDGTFFWHMAFAKKRVQREKVITAVSGKTASSMGGRDAPCGADTWRAVHPVFSPFMQKEGTYRDIGVFSCILSENDCGKAQTVGWEMAAVSSHCCGGVASVAGTPCVV